MEAFKNVTSQIIPLPIKDVDTDMIIPAQFLTSIDRGGYGENLFRRLRDADPDFVLNKKEFLDAKILLAGSNFGCGSSREHAVWALLGWGIRVVIAESFADIFFGNSAKNGLVLIELAKDHIEELFSLAKNSQNKVTVDLAAQKIVLSNNQQIGFSFDSFRKHCILNGLDDLDYILSHKEKIDTFFSRKAD